MYIPPDYQTQTLSRTIDNCEKLLKALRKIKRKAAEQGTPFTEDDFLRSSLGKLSLKMAKEAKKLS